MIKKAMVWDINRSHLLPIQPNYAIDTNVLYWMHYSRASLSPNNYQIKTYPNFISHLISQQKKLMTTTYNIAELITIIERNEYRIYLEQNNLQDSEFSIKKYREDEVERVRVKQEIQSVLTQIENIYTIVQLDLKMDWMSTYTNDFEKHSCDVGDYSCIQQFLKEKINCFLTDDIDFCSIEGINVFTSNLKAISLS